MNRVLSKFNSYQDLEKLKSFLKKHKNLGQTKSIFNEVLKIVISNKRWMEMNLGPIKLWFKENLIGKINLFKYITYLVN